MKKQINQIMRLAIIQKVNINFFLYFLTNLFTSAKIANAMGSPTIKVINEVSIIILE